MIFSQHHWQHDHHHRHHKNHHTSKLTTMNGLTFSTDAIDHDCQNNVFILFVGRKSMQYKNINKLEGNLQSTIDNGFGCFQRPVDKMAYYHNGHDLRLSSNPNVTSFSPHYNLCDCLTHVAVFPMLTRELTPVCYWSSFAMLSRNMCEKSGIISFFGRSSSYWF